MNDEHPIMKKAREEHPELFEAKPFIEGPEALAPLGIMIPGKESFPYGYLKCYPEDFIVEEIGLDGKAYTIDHASFSDNDGPLEGEGDTIYATLVKCGLSTIEAVRDLARQLGIEERNIGYAGIKDKHAITSQLVSIRGTSEAALRSVSSPFYFLKNAYRGKNVLKAGDLTGNRFTIYIRTLPDQNISTLASGSEDFFNYFYLQRFASPRYINYEWGYEILRGNHEKAIESLLFSQSEREIPYITDIRARAKSMRSWGAIAKEFEPAAALLISEKMILDHLVKYPQDYLGALLKVPEQVQLWLYALASLLFNEKISAAIRNNEQVPPTLPFFLSDERADIDLFTPELKALGIFPPPFENLRPFRFLKLSHRTAPTIEKATDISAASIAGGTIASFTLSKGCYATTFLSHHVNLVSEAPLDGMSKDRLDVDAAFPDPARTETIRLFREVRTKIENL